MRAGPGVVVAVSDTACPSSSLFTSGPGANAACSAIGNREKAAVAESIVRDAADYTISDVYVTLFGRILSDETLKPSSRALILAEAASLPGRPDLAWRYWELSDARRALLQVHLCVATEA